MSFLESKSANREKFGNGYLEAQQKLIPFNNEQLHSLKSFEDEAAVLKLNLLQLKNLEPLLIELIKINNLVQRATAEEYPFQEYYSELEKKDLITITDLEELLREKGILSITTFDTAYQEDPKRYADSILEQYVSSYTKASDTLKARFRALIQENPMKFFNDVGIEKGDWWKIVWEEEKSRKTVIEELSADQILRAIETDHFPIYSVNKELFASQREKFMKVIQSMPAASYGSSHRINLLAKYLDSNTKVEYFSTSIPHSNSLCYGFMDDGNEIFKTIDSGDPILTWNELARVMQNYSDRKNRVYFSEMFDRYERILKANNKELPSYLAKEDS